MLNILKEIYTTPELGQFLGFKGGTMAMFFHQLDRFSVDLDFDLMDLEKKEEIFKTLEGVLKKFGEIKESYIKSYTIFFLLSYGERDRNIKIEINTRDFGSKYEIQSYMGISVRIMVKEDIFAHKLCAWYERYSKTSRDMYDVHFFLSKFWSPREEIIKKRTGMSYKELIEVMIKKLEEDPPKNILSGLGELLDEKQKNWVKNKLVEDLIFQLNTRLKN